MGALSSKLDISKETMQKEVETDNGNYKRDTQKTKIF